jgi:hypothetical protein
MILPGSEEFCRRDVTEEFEKVPFFFHGDGRYRFWDRGPAFLCRRKMRGTWSEMNARA